MSAKKNFTSEEAKRIGEKLGIKWDRFNVDQFRRGMDVELEHGLCSPSTNVTGNDPLITAKIALAHLNEFPDYYDRLEGMEKEAEEYWGDKFVTLNGDEARIGNVRRLRQKPLP